MEELFLKLSTSFSNLPFFSPKISFSFIRGAPAAVPAPVGKNHANWRSCCKFDCKYDWESESKCEKFEETGESSGGERDKREREGSVVWTSATQNISFLQQFCSAETGSSSYSCS